MRACVRTRRLESNVDSMCESVTQSRCVRDDTRLNKAPNTKAFEFRLRLSVVCVLRGKCEGKVGVEMRAEHGCESESENEGEGVRDVRYTADIRNRGSGIERHTTNSWEAIMWDVCVGRYNVRLPLFQSSSADVCACAFAAAAVSAVSALVSVPIPPVPSEGSAAKNRRTTAFPFYIWADAIQKKMAAEAGRKRRRSIINFGSTSRESLYHPHSPAN